MQREKRKASKGVAELLVDHDEYEDAQPALKVPKKSDKVEKVRVWWPPTKDKERTGFSGAYWPATVLRKGSNYLKVEYDNGESEKVDPDNIFPYDVPIEFGKETIPLVVGEFVEVSNNSKTDPCAWLGKIATIGKKCLIDYPFHDSPSEYIKLELLRRARVWDDLDWKYIEMGQKWRAGEVTSPMELNLILEEEYYKALKQAGGSGKSSKSKQAADAASDDAESDDRSSSEEDEPQPEQKQRGRPRKPQHPSRAVLDDSNSTEHKDEKPKGAKKRKPAAVRQAPIQEQLGIQHQQPQQQRQKQKPSKPPKRATLAQPTAAEAAAAAAARVPSTAQKAVVTLAKNEEQEPDQMQNLEQPELLLPARVGTAQQGAKHLPALHSNTAAALDSTTGGAAAPSGAKDSRAGSAAVKPPKLVSVAKLITTVTEVAADQKVKAAGAEKHERAKTTAGQDSVKAAANRFKAEAVTGKRDPGEPGTETPAHQAAPTPAAATKRASIKAAGSVPGTAAAPVTLTELVQGLTQPVLIVPAADSNDHTQPILLLPKGTASAMADAGLRSMTAGAVATSAGLVGIAGDPGPMALGPGTSKLASGKSDAGLPAGIAAAVVAATPEAAGGSAGADTRTPPTTAAPATSGICTPLSVAAQMLGLPPGSTAVAAAAELEARLSQLNLTEARLALGELYTSEAYLLLVDCWRADSPKLGDALRSHKANILGCAKPDYQAFMIGVFGLDRMKSLELLKK